MDQSRRQKLRLRDWLDEALGAPRSSKRPARSALAAAAPIIIWSLIVVIIAAVALFGFILEVFH